ncbi:uncharacterized protein LOC125645482 isoform X2 [Ostrea edulis]|uniref:uncharacterized protein LOC125645482 isoform X2 n=1 Tax=Ostrea edulis TaxID=37623 RepID=UPI00209604F4|nr:uncharacterized protein LOC125645482 isoform X2 [Ostrea edulis]
MTETPRQGAIYLGIKDKLNDGESASVVDSKTGMYKAREYKPKSYLPKIREFKPKNREFKPREFEPKKEVTVHTYDKLREYNHFYDAEPPEDETNRPAKDAPFFKHKKALGSIKRTIVIMTPRQ